MDSDLLCNIIFGYILAAILAFFYWLGRKRRDR